MTEYHKKFNNFEYELFNHEKVNELIHFVYTDGLKPYTDFKKTDWKNGYFFHHKGKLFNMWAVTYYGGLMSFFIDYHYSTSKRLNWTARKIALCSYLIPKFDNDADIINKDVNYYFDKIVKEIEKKLNSQNNHRHLPHNLNFDNNYFKIHLDYAEIVEDKLFCTSISNENFSDVWRTIYDLFMIKHYLD